eukprot:1159798-Pelagomonas_calceolata.AAC.13
MDKKTFQSAGTYVIAPSSTRHDERYMAKARLHLFASAKLPLLAGFMLCFKLSEPMMQKNGKDRLIQPCQRKDTNMALYSHERQSFQHSRFCCLRTLRPQQHFQEDLALVTLLSPTTALVYAAQYPLQQGSNARPLEPGAREEDVTALPLEEVQNTQVIVAQRAMHAGICRLCSATTTSSRSMVSCTMKTPGFEGDITHLACWVYIKDCMLISASWAKLTANTISEAYFDKDMTLQVLNSSKTCLCCVWLTPALVDTCFG